MQYTPLKLSTRTSTSGVIGTMPVNGINRRDLPQLLDPSSASYIENYLLFGQGKMKKRGGSTLDSDTGSTDEQTLREDYRNNFEITAYGTTVKAYDRTTGVFTTIKSDFTANNGGFGGDRYGDYFFISNLRDGLWRISRTITYNQYQGAVNNYFTINAASGTIGGTILGVTSGATANVFASTGTTTILATVNTIVGTFIHSESITSGSLSGATVTNINPLTVGKIVTGATSGAKALILEHTDNGATGTLTLGEISGTFQNAEVLTDDNTSPGGGTTTSVLAFTITAVTAPKARYCKVINDRLLLYQLSTNAAAWAYSEKDDGSNPCFINFTSASGFTAPGGGYHRAGITANTAEMIGDDIIFIGFEKGWHAFSITQTEIGGVISKYDQKIQTSTSTGIQKAKMTEVGLIACGELGIKRLVSLGQVGIPYSEQWETLTEQLGEDFFDDADFTDADIDYDSDKGYIYITYAKDSPTNNFVLAIKAQPAGVEASVLTGATSFITGWSIKSFMRRGGTLYGTSAVNGKTFKLLDGETDEGSAIYTQYLQEINVGTLTDSFDLDEFYAGGSLTSASTLTISFDRYTRKGRFDERVRSGPWTKTNSYPSGNAGWAEAAYGSSGYGGTTVGGLVEDFTGANVKLRSNMRAFVRFESNDYSDHVISWFSVSATITTPIRRRPLILTK